MNFDKKRSIKLPETLGDTIYKYLKTEIMEGKIAPNQRIQLREVADSFGISTTPVREAVQKLAVEGYLIVNARKKEIYVPAVTMDEVEEFLEVVGILDMSATKKALDKITDDDVLEIKKITKKLGELIEKGNIRSYVRMTIQIHELLWKICENKFLSQSLANLAEKSIFYLNQAFIYLGENSLVDHKHRDHLNLADAIEKRDAGRVEEILRDHWKNVP